MSFGKRQRRRRRSRSGGQVTHHAVAVHRFILWSGELSTADGSRRSCPQHHHRACKSNHQTSCSRSGVGVGVASGFVTVGVIGGASRLEYTAVGSPVNLASRLCSEALHGEILVDERTVQLLGTSVSPSTLRQGSILNLKGFAQPTPSYVLQGV